MVAPDPALERRALWASIAVTAALGTLGIGWGIASRSQMILLDGAYAIVGIVVSLLLLKASRLAGAEPSPRHPFGLEAATPLAIGVQGFVLLATLLYATYEAVLSIRSGGGTVTAGWAIAYGVIVTIVSVGFTAWISRAARDSDLIRAETAAWRVGAWRGFGMVIGFAVLAVLVRRGDDRVAPYVDPAMVLVSCLALAPAPLRMIRGAVAELLESAPPEHVRRPVEVAVAELTDRYGIDGPDLYVTKVGPKLYVEVAGEVDATRTVAEEHELREQLRERLDDLPYDVWLNFELHPRPD